MKRRKHISCCFVWQRYSTSLVRDYDFLKLVDEIISKEMVGLKRQEKSFEVQKKMRVTFHISEQCAALSAAYVCNISHTGRI